MITQNPITGRARKKLAGVYARTLYGKNVLQSCPPPTKGKQTANQLAVCSSFAYISKLSNQVDASLLNRIFYETPIGRSRRAEWMHQLSAGRTKENGLDVFDPSLIEKLGGNPTVSESPFVFTPTSANLEINFSQLSKVGNAIDTVVPCLILICPSTNQCVSLLAQSSLGNESVILQHLSPTYQGHQCYIFPLWAVNVGTNRNPIIAYGSYTRVE